MSASAESGPTRRDWLRLAGLMAAVPASAWASALRADEQVLFVPGIARWLDPQRLEVDILAWVHERERRPGARPLFARYLGLKLKSLSDEERALFDQRCALFLTDSERRKVVDVAFEVPLNHTVSLPATNSSGRTSARVVVDASTLPSDATIVPFRAVLGDGDTRSFPGHAVIVPDEGLSVISDIDDTIKVTNVLDRREMLLNTFARPFEATPGMVGHFKQLAEQPGTRFHYLSASPIQLAPALKAFLRDASFPPGSLHLRESTHWRTLVPGDGASREHKLGLIKQLLADFPQRRFMLVGDSGEADPEIYALVAREHPTRIEGIIIRDVRDEGRAAPRLAQTFDGLPAALWHILPSSGEPWPL